MENLGPRLRGDDELLSLSYVNLKNYKEPGDSQFG